MSSSKSTVPDARPDMHRGGQLWDEGRLEEALEFYQAALVLQEERHGPLHGETANAVFGVGGSLFRMERCAEAVPFFRRAVAIYGTLGAEAAFELMMSHEYLGRALFRVGECQESSHHLETCIEMADENGETPSVAALFCAGCRARDLGRYATARRHLARVLELSVADGMRRTIYFELGVINREEGDVAGALLNLEASLEIGDRLGADDQRAELREAYTAAYVLGQHAKALHLVGRLLEAENAVDPRSFEAACAYAYAGDAMTAARRVPEAVAFFKRSLEIHASVGFTARAVRPMQALAFLLESQGDLPGATTMRAWSKRIADRLGGE